MIKYNNNTINDWNFGDDDIIKVYKHGAVCYYKITSGDTPTPVKEPCFAVVDDITLYSDTEFEDVFNKADGKWYKLNNLNQYEQYGVYGSGRNITYYDGKLTIDGDYEYQYSGGSWVNLGEVSGGTATLPDVPFTLNYNAKNYDASTKTLLKTEGQLANVDAVITAGTPTVNDGYLTIATNTRATISGYQNYFNRTNSTPNLTIISKQKTNDNRNVHLFANRDSSYNWMYRATASQLKFHGSSQINGTNVTTQPVIESVRVDSSRTLKFNNYTDNTTTSVSNFSYGSTNSTATALFAGYASNTSEWFAGDFYWVYMCQSTLTDEQVQQVIDYNEGGGGQTEYPKYYDEIQDPPDNLVFSSMAEAEAYECPWVGMHATIDGDRYIFSGDSQSGYEWVEQTYTQYEYIRTSSAATQYYTFDTNFYPTTANTLEVKFEMADTSVDWGDMVAWGLLSNLSATTSFQFATVTANYQAIVRTGGSTATTYRYTIGASKAAVYTLPLSATSGTYSVDGGSAQTIQYNVNSGFNLPSTVSMRIFGSYGNDTYFKSAVGKMYYVKVYDGSGNLVKHYVPSDYNGTPCFYEIVDGEYIMDTYTGSNHGTLTLGPAI